MVPVAKATGCSGLAIAVAFLVSSGTVPQAQSGNPASTGRPTPTFTRDVLPILQRSCQQCHHPGTSAPMSLMTFQEVRPWARSIRQKVTSREMPPWHIDRSIGEYLADPSLSDAEITTIASWVDSGGPEGRPADAPPPTTFASDSEWTYGEPDLVVRMEKGFRIPADGPDFIPEEIVDPKLTEDRYVKWVQIIPDAKRAVHHAHVYVDLARRDRSRRPWPRHGLERRQQHGPDRVRCGQRCGRLSRRHDEDPEEGLALPLRVALPPVRRGNLRSPEGRHQVLPEGRRPEVRRHVAPHPHGRRQRLGAQPRTDRGSVAAGRPQVVDRRAVNANRRADRGEPAARARRS